MNLLVGNGIAEIDSINTFSTFSLLLIINSIVLIGLIVTQNENTKDITGNQPSSTSPFEKITWISFVLQLSLLLIKIKTTDF
jgi:uncharacterized protein with PQ loop repeat